MNNLSHKPPRRIGKPTTKLERAERRSRVFGLRRAGLGPPEIARALGVSERTIFNDMKALAADLRKETARESAEALAFEVARLDALQRSAWPLAMGSAERRNAKGKLVPTVPPDLRAVEAVRRIVESRAKLLGLYEPEVQDLEAQGDYMAESFARAVEQELGPEGKGLTLRVLAKWRGILDAEAAKNGLAAKQR